MALSKNFRELREELEGEGIVFSSQTDTEVIAHLVAQAIAQGATPEVAVSESLKKKLKGAFALAIIFCRS